MHPRRPRRTQARPLRFAATQHISLATAQSGGSVMIRFLKWLDKLAMTSPYAELRIFDLH
jgi:hypothetical protein